MDTLSRRILELMATKEVDQLAAKANPLGNIKMDKQEISILQDAN